MLGRYLIIGSLSLSAITAAGWYVTKGHLDRARTDLAASRAAYSQVINTIEAERATAARLAESEKTALEELSNATAKIDSLRADVESGRAKLRIKATCPAVPTNAPAERAHDAGAPELTADARTAYFDLRRQHEQALTQIKFLQNYARECYQIAPKSESR